MEFPFSQRNLGQSSQRKAIRLASAEVKKIITKKILYNNVNQKISKDMQWKGNVKRYK